MPKPDPKPSYLPAKLPLEELNEATPPPRSWYPSKNTVPLPNLISSSSSGTLYSLPFATCAEKVLPSHDWMLVPGGAEGVSALATKPKTVIIKMAYHFCRKFLIVLIVLVNLKTVSCCLSKVGSKQKKT